MSRTGHAQRQPRPLVDQPIRAPSDVRERRDAVFTGEYRHAVDEKGRLAVPARFRPQLAGTCVVARWLDTLSRDLPDAGLGGALDQGREPSDDRSQRAPAPAAAVRRGLRDGARPPGSGPRPAGPPRRSRAWRPRPSSSATGTTPRSGRPRAGTSTAGASTTRTRSRRRSPVWGSDVAPHALPGSARDPQPIRGGVMQEGHLPVMPVEVIETLAPAAGSLQIDATVGGGGHTERILEAASPDGRVLGLDADPLAIDRVARPPRPVRRPAGPAPGELPRARGRRPGRGLRRRRRRAVRPRPVVVPARRPRPRLRVPRRRPARHAVRHRAGASRRRSSSRRSPPTSSPRCSASTARSPRRGGSRRRSSRPADRAGPDRRGAGGPRGARRARQPAPEAPPDPPRDAASSRPCGSRSTRSWTRSRTASAPRSTCSGPAAASSSCQLPLARGPDRQAVPPGRAPRLHLSARGAGLRLRQAAPPPPRDPAVPDPDRRGDHRQPARPQRAAPCRRAARGVAEEEQASIRQTRHRPAGPPRRIDPGMSAGPAHGGGVP